jgi:CBS domain-containing protein
MTRTPMDPTNGNDTELYDLTRIRGIGSTRQGWFRDVLGIFTIQDLARASLDEIDLQFRAEGHPVSRPEIAGWIAQAQALMTEPLEQPLATPLATDESELSGEGEPELRGEGEPELRGEGEPELRGEGEPELRGEGEPELRGEGEPELRGEGEPELRGEGEPELRGEGEPELRGEDALSRLPEPDELSAPTPVMLETGATSLPPEETPEGIAEGATEAATEGEEVAQEELPNRQLGPVIPELDTNVTVPLDVDVTAPLQVAELGNIEPATNLPAAIESEEWATLATFVVKVETRSIAGKIEQQTTVRHEELNVSQVWSEPESGQLQQWMQEQLRTVLPLQAVAKPVSAIPHEVVRISQVRLLQPRRAGSAMMVNQSGQIFPNPIRSDDPLAIEVLTELAVTNLPKSPMTYRIQCYARNRVTHVTTSLGETHPGALTERQLFYTDVLPETTLLPGMYRLQVLVTLQGEIATPGYFEIPLLQVV